MIKKKSHAGWLVAMLISMAAPAGAQTANRLPSQTAAEEKTQVELEFWRSVERLGTPEAYQAYLETYPNGRFAPLARVAARKLTPTPAGNPIAPAAPAALTPPAPSVSTASVPVSSSQPAVQFAAGSQLPVLNELLQESGGATFVVGERLRGPGVLTMGGLGSRKQVPIPAGEWTLLAAIDHETERQSILGRPGIDGSSKVASLVLAGVQGVAARSLLLVTLNRLAAPAYNFRWHDVEQCEQAGTQSWHQRKEKAFFADQCLVIRPVGPKGVEGLMPAQLWKELSVNLAKLGGSLADFNLETSVFTTSAQADYLRVTRLDCHQTQPGATTCADFSYLMSNWLKPPEGLAARIEWAQQYMPLAYDGFRRKLALPELTVSR